MLYYSSFILQKLHPSSAPVTSALAKQTGVAIAKLAGVSTALIIVDRVGRRSLLLVGSSLMLLSHVAFAICFASIEAHESAVDLESVGIAILYVFIYAWNFSWAPLMWVVCSELLPDELRSIGMGLTFAVFWLASALVNQTLLSTLLTIGTTSS